MKLIDLCQEVNALLTADPTRMEWPVVGLSGFRVDEAGKFIEPVFEPVSESVFVPDQPVRILYRDKSGSITDRVVVPYNVEGGILYGFCRLRQEDRTFVISRILLASTNIACAWPLAGSERT